MPQEVFKVFIGQERFHCVWRPEVKLEVFARMLLERREMPGSY